MSARIAGGGGGRIALLLAESAFAGTAQARGGLENHGEPSGQDGTGFWAQEQTISPGETVQIAHQPLVRYGFRLDWAGASSEVVVVRLQAQNAGGDWLLRGQFGEPLASQGDTWQGASVVAGEPPTFEMLVPLTSAGAYYFDVFNTDYGPSDPSARFTLEVQTVDRYVPPVFLGQGGNQGTTTLSVAGAGFEPGMEVEFRDADGQSLRTFAAAEITTLRLLVAADLRGLAPGAVDVAVIWPDQEAVVLAAAFEITGDPPGQLEITSELPAAVRALRTYTLWVTCANVGGSDLPAPLLRIVSEDNLALRLSTADPFVRRELYVVAIRDHAPYDVIPPGESVRFPVQFIPEGPSHHRAAFRIETLIGEGKEIDWEATKAASQPVGISSPAWDAIWANFMTRMGSSTERFAARMWEDAGYLARLQNGTHMLARLLGMELTAAAGGTPARAKHGTRGWMCRAARLRRPWRSFVTPPTRWPRVTNPAPWVSAGCIISITGWNASRRNGCN